MIFRTIVSIAALAATAYVAYFFWGEYEAKRARQQTEAAASEIVEYAKNECAAARRALANWDPREHLDITARRRRPALDNFVADCDAAGL